MAIVDDPDWWRQACVYQIYPRSFADDNGDGIGDLQGITWRIPYLKQLGIDAIWLSPFYPSALKDGGYDVADYRNVDPRIGTLEDFDAMTKACKEAGLKVIVDIVPNHCSDDHPWFQEALKSPKGSVARARFHFQDGEGPDGSQPPSDWHAAFGGAAWNQVEDGQWYLGFFAPFQPDWNWDNPEVREDFLKTLRFWGDRGVSGFRVDVASACAKDLTRPLPSQAEIEKIRMNANNKDAPPNLHPFFDRDAVLDYWKEWRKVFNEYTPALTAVGEAWVPSHRQPLYASPDGLGQTFSFDLLIKEHDCGQFRRTIEEGVKDAKRTGSSTTWVFSNHDVLRHATRFGFPKLAEEPTDIYSFMKLGQAYLKSGGKEPKCDLELGLKRARADTLMMLALPGCAYIYQGEELGLPEVVEIPPEQRQDPSFLRTNGESVGRDGCRVPLPWKKSGKNFGNGSGKPTHLPQPEWMGKFSVEAEDGVPGSTLELYRKALKLRRELQTKEDLEWASDAPGILHFKRPGGWEVLTNFNSEPVDPPKGQVLISSSELENGKVPQDTTVWVKSG